MKSLLFWQVAIKQYLFIFFSKHKIPIWRAGIDTLESGYFWVAPVYTMPAQNKNWESSLNATFLMLRR